MKKSFLVSLTLHLLMLSLLFLGSNQNTGKGQGSKEQTGDHAGNKKPGMEVEITEFQPKPKENEDKGISEMDRNGYLAEIHNAYICDNFFGGIGIEEQYDLATNQWIITKVADDYPADRIGIKVGDVMLDDRDLIRGEIGTSVTVTIRRNGEIIKYQTTREKICITKKGKR